MLICRAPKHTDKYELQTRTLVPFTTNLNDPRSISFYTFGDATMTDPEAVLHVKGMLEGNRIGNPEAIISGKLFRQELKPGERSELRLVEIMEDPREQSLEKPRCHLR